MKFSARFDHYKIFTIASLLISSCAYDNTSFSEDFGDPSEKEDYKVVSIFLIKDNVFKMRCDISGNKLMMKFSKKENKWKRSKYTSKGC